MAQRPAAVVKTVAKLYTKKGDRGETGLPGDRRVSKFEPLFEVLGLLDQTSAQIGLAIALAKQEGDLNPIPTLERVQRILLSIGSTLASVEGVKGAITEKLTKEVSWLEETIDKLDEELPPLRNFILVGGTPASATLHLIRTSVRELERRYHQLKPGAKSEALSQYFNRLSDFFFQVARNYNFRHHVKESIWRGD